MTLAGRTVLLIVGGGIAAYKTPELVRRLVERGAVVRCVLTEAGRQFVTPLSLATVSHAPVETDLFTPDGAQGNIHIQLARTADIVVVAPATADLIARLANGHASDLASTILIASTRPLLLAPAMNGTMWAHPAVARNVGQLRRDGHAFVGPAEGEMAESGETGLGRMAEPLDIVAAIEAVLAPRETPLAGRRALVTSGPTREAIDPIRFISNRSSGQQGHAIAAALAELGAEVHLVSGPVNLPDPAHVTVHRVETALEMQAAVDRLLPVDIAVFAAAVGDWRLAEIAGGKLKKQGEPPVLRLVENPDILAGVGNRASGRPALVVGFAAETDDLLANARGKLDRKGADMIVANNVAEHAMGSKDNRVSLVTTDGVEHWPALDKTEVARRLAQTIARTLARGT